MKNLEALELIIRHTDYEIGRTAPDELDVAYAQLRRALEALDAVEVLDGYAGRFQLPLVPSPSRLLYRPGYAVNLEPGIQGTGDTPHAARIAAAAAVRKEG